MAHQHGLTNFVATLGTALNDSHVTNLKRLAERESHRFPLHLEPGVSINSELVADIAGTLREFADWHATPTVDVRLSDPPKLAALVQRAVDRAAAPAKRAWPSCAAGSRC
jgi:hypothetical protein